MSERLVGGRITRGDNFLWLLLSLLVLFFFSALFEQLESDVLGRLTGIFLTVIVMVAVWSIGHSYRSLYTRVGITALLVAVVSLELLFDHYGLAILQLVMLLAFFALTIVLAGRQVLF